MWLVLGSVKATKELAKIRSRYNPIREILKLDVVGIESMAFWLTV